MGELLSVFFVFAILCFLVLWAILVTQRAIQKISGEIFFGVGVAFLAAVFFAAEIFNVAFILLCGICVTLIFIGAVLKIAAECESC